MHRLVRGSLGSTPLAAAFIISLTLLGCGGGSSSDHDGGAGKAGGSAKGGNGGTSSTGKGGASTGGSAAGHGGSGTGGSATGGASTGGDGGASTGGDGGASTGGDGGAAAGNGGSSTGGSATGGSSTGGATAGSGGAGPACVSNEPCTLSGNVKGVCANNACVACAGDSACKTAYDQTYICVAGDCVVGDCQQNADCQGGICNTTSHLCESCTAGTAGDTACTTAYGSGHICVSGKCAQGTCHNNADCGTNGQICNAASQCVACGTDDAACAAAYGSGYICVGGGCVTGTCHNSGECSTGNQACNASHVCANCASDAECAGYPQARICVSGACNPGTCHDNAGCSDGKVCSGNVCVACTTDGQCGAGQVCLTGACTPGNCHDATSCQSTQGVCLNNSCAACTTDGQCVSGYGNNHLCQSGKCVAGNCRAKGDCLPTNQICNAGQLACENCTTDPQCTSEYGTNHICLGGVCVTGNCHMTSTCPAGQLCNQTTHACGGCGTSDTACQTDLGSGYICVGNACVTGDCHAAGDCNDTTKVCKSNSCSACASNSECVTAYGNNHVCVSGACVSGNCQTSADCGGTQVCNTSTHTCEACAGATAQEADMKCLSDTFFGPMHVCLAGQCVAGNCHDTSTECANGQICGAQVAHTCGGCASSDAACRADPTYGNGSICLASGSCVTGDCHDTSTECGTGKLCGISSPHTCGDCGGATSTIADAECTSDGRYGGGTICYQGSCQVGNCHATSQDCTGVNTGLICGSAATNVCGACTSDAQCKADPFYGSTFICNTANGPDRGKCVSASCSNNSNACAANGGDFCCSGTCSAGNCCSNTDCANNAMFGNGYTCTNHTCTKCDGITSNTYYVDPINGNDATATGSGKSSGAANAGCAFQTVTRAMQVIGTVAGAGTKVVIVGSGTPPTGLAAGDTLPITVQPNVTIATTGGAVTITLPAATSQTNPANTSGFVLASAGSGIAGDAAAPLTIDGNGNTSGVAVAVTGGTASLSNLTIQNTRANAISVTGGTLNIGAGVAVKNAGSTTAGIARDDLAISGGVVNINVPSGQATTSFTGASQYGINVTALGSVNVTGVAVTPPNGNGTVVVSGNHGAAGLVIRQTANAASLATNSINGLVAWTNDTDGARLSGGSKIKIRNSVFGANVVDGIRIVQGTSGTNAQTRDVSGIDLGLVGDFGHNYLQTPVGSSGRNQTAGLCVNLGGTATGTLGAAGNMMVYGTGSGMQVDCSATAQTVIQGNCTSGNSLGIQGGTSVTVLLNMCN
jgi:Cys-rich repeat protein